MTNIDSVRVRLIQRLLSLSLPELVEAEILLNRLGGREPKPAVAPSVAPPVTAELPKLDWPHAPPHRLGEYGTFFVTAGTWQRRHVFVDAARRDYLHSELLSHAKASGWQLEAWAVFSNHYHLVLHALEGHVPLDLMLKELHRKTAIHVNELDEEPGRQVWFNFRETALTYETSYYARLAYTHENAVKHRLVAEARQYRWCSAAWFERAATPAQITTLSRIKTDEVKVFDDYDPV